MLKRIGIALLVALAGCGAKATPIAAAGSQPVRPVEASADSGASNAEDPPSKEVAVATVGEAMDHPWLDVPRRRIRVGETDLAVFDTGGA